ncbi:MAG: hypothetical protein ACYCQI_11345 [Gammaproteobacteria bacterium]
MPFPSSKVAVALVDVYLQRKEKEWNTLKESSAWLFKTLTWSTYKGKEAKEKECADLKTKIEEDKKEQDKWIELCIYLGEKATAELEERGGKASLLVSYMHLLRTYILSKLNLDDTKNLLDTYKKPLKKIAFPETTPNESKEATEAQKPKPEEINSNLLKLAYLGDDEAIAEACKKNLLKYYVMEDSWPVYFEDNFYKSTFFDTEVKPYILENPTFEEFEASIAPKIDVKKAEPIASDPVAPETVAALNLVESASPEVVSAEEYDAAVSAAQSNEVEPAIEKDKIEVAGPAAMIATPILPVAEVKVEVQPQQNLDPLPIIAAEIPSQTHLPDVASKAEIAPPSVAEPELKANPSPNVSAELPATINLPDAALKSDAIQSQITLPDTREKSIIVPDPRPDDLPRLEIPVPTTLPEITAPEALVAKANSPKAANLLVAAEKPVERKIEEPEPDTSVSLPAIKIMKKTKKEDKSILETASPSKTIYMSTRYTISSVIGPSQLGLLARPAPVPIEDYRTRLRDRSTIKPRKWN